MSDLDDFDFVAGPARERVDAEEQHAAALRGEIVEDRRRQRPRYFDGRFLTARDLVREQQYTLLRQADYGQLAGTGVIAGLDVRADATGQRLVVSVGQGLARSGELVAVPREVAIDVARLPVLTRQNREVQALLGQPGKLARFGMFVLTARPVEYAREPITAYPTSISGERSLQDGELIEAVWFSLVPLVSIGSREVLGRGRARLAREVFLGGLDPAHSTDGLALAIVGIVRDRVAWIDPWLVRRDAGSRDVLGFGLGSRRQREAQQHQYVRQLDDTIAARKLQGLGDSFEATQEFDLLPPVGPLPRAAVRVEGTRLVQDFFPPQIYTEISLVPEDELAKLIDEGLQRAPIDLRGDEEGLESVPVSVLVPVSRREFVDRASQLSAAIRSPLPLATGRPLAAVRPLDGLLALRLRRDPPPPTDPTPLDLAPWSAAIESAETLWYVRRSQFSTVSAIVIRGGDADAAPPSEALDNDIQVLLADADEVARFDNLFANADPELIAAVNDLLGDELFAIPAYVNALFGELAYVARRAELDSPSVVPRSPWFELPSASVGTMQLRPLRLADIERVALRYRSVGLGTLFGGDAHNLATPAHRRRRAVLGQSLVVPELDRLAFEGGFLPNLSTILDAGDVDSLRALVGQVGLVPPPPPVEQAMAYEKIVQMGELQAFHYLWHTLHPSAREHFDELMSEIGSSPMFASLVMVALLSLGWELGTLETEAQVTSVDELIDTWEIGAPAPAAFHLKRKLDDARSVLFATGFSMLALSENVTELEDRLRDEGFPSGDPGSEQAVLAWRLVALSHPLDMFRRSLEGLPSEDRVRDFVRDIDDVVAQRDITGMRQRVAELFGL